MKMFKKLLLTCVAVLGLAGVGSVVSSNANASNETMAPYAYHASRIRRAYVRKPMRIYLLKDSPAAAFVHTIGHAWLWRGERVGIVPYYNWDHRGYVIHVPGRRGIYYTSTNRYNWFGFKTSCWVHGRKVRVWAPVPRYLKSHFRRTNNKRLLKKSGYNYDKGLPNTLGSKYWPNNRKAYIPKNFKLISRESDPTEWFSGGNSYADQYDYIGHNTWKIYFGNVNKNDNYY